MQTQLHPRYKQLPVGEEADAILRNCVHCGFCNATCPTYQLTGDERDGPRGRIYLIKQLLETDDETEKTRHHLDRCLNCRSCETTCPSGVEYGHLLDLGKEIIERKQKRSLKENLLRHAIRFVLPHRRRFAFMLFLGQIVKPILPANLRAKIPSKQEARIETAASNIESSRTMLLLSGCVQAAATPNTNVSAIRVFEKLGIKLLEIDEAGCCGALSYHLSEADEGRGFMRRNIDAWWPAIKAGAESIVVTASGCGTTVKDYGYILKDDPKYAEKAQVISELAKDISEVLVDEDLSQLQLTPDSLKTAVHCPCSLQHGQQLFPDVVSNMLKGLGFSIAGSKDNHLCCGSAGTYSIFQPDMSELLLDEKIEALTINNPSRIVTANIGCQMHIASKADIEVNHWIELLDQ